RALFDELHDLYQSGEREKISVLFLDKTSRAFEINSGNYTAWMIRRRCLLANPLYLDTAEL
ncbi:protein farnesyltransferase alpha subunit, partial [Cystoisospora suis]